MGARGGMDLLQAGYLFQAVSGEVASDEADGPRQPEGSRDNKKKQRTVGFHANAGTILPHQNLSNPTHR
jgi:hypothetical protein